MRTRELLLDATIECLVELGYAKTSTTEICARAGLSRGAQLHQFHTKAELLAHAIEHLAEKQIERLRVVAAEIPPGSSQERALIELVWVTFSGPLAKATVELWIASAAEPELREQLLRVQREVTREAFEVCARTVEGPTERLESVFWLTINLIRGLTLDGMLGGNPGRLDHLLEQWKAIAESALAGC
jgi:AcrR family transcriptional regulator